MKGGHFALFPILGWIDSVFHTIKYDASHQFFLADIHYHERMLSNTFSTSIDMNVWFDHVDMLEWLVLDNESVLFSWEN
jgi:hypothetical protein